MNQQSRLSKKISITNPTSNRDKKIRAKLKTLTKLSEDEEFNYARELIYKLIIFYHDQLGD